MNFRTVTKSFRNPCFYYRKAFLSSRLCVTKPVRHDIGKATHEIEAEISLAKRENRVSILVDILNSPGSLHHTLKYFSDHKIDLTSIESRPSSSDSSFKVYIDFAGCVGENSTDKLLKELRANCSDVQIVVERDASMLVIEVQVLDDRLVPWFPRDVCELDHVANKVLEAGVDIESDHPGFLDSEYRKRRSVLASLAKGFRNMDPVPIVTYTEEENKTWGLVYNKLLETQGKYACAEYLSIMPLMQAHCGYCAEKIPQLEYCSLYRANTNTFEHGIFLIFSRKGQDSVFAPWQVYQHINTSPSTSAVISPTVIVIFKSIHQVQPLRLGCENPPFFLLSQLSQQPPISFITRRHSSRPFYTPEPDVCHELMGHAPMFADPDFAAFSQEIGLASLGASDADVKRLATCYWHSVEFGLVREGGVVKAYGAGLLSSFGELEYACATAASATDSSDSPSLSPQLLPWDPETASQTAYPITTYQPVYFVAESLSDAKSKMRNYCNTLPRPFHAFYNPLTRSVWVDRAVRAADRAEP